MMAATELQMDAGHIPVLLDQVVDLLRPHDGAVMIDGTFGDGGYSRGLLDAAKCRVWAIDRDPEAVARGVELSRQYAGRFTIVEGRFGDMDRLLDLDSVNGIALDLGVSSPQLDDPERGFSFQTDGPLDMRMTPRGPSAADIVNHELEPELADIIYQFGEERHSRRVARAIVEARRREPIARTSTLADIVAGAVPRSRDGLHPATRTFQALRIYVNDEIGELHRGLEAAEAMLAPGGRLVVVAFHSLEDRAVKNFLRNRSGRSPQPSRHLPMSSADSRPPTFRLLDSKALRPDDAEVAANPRARSARLRAAERTDAPAWPREARQ